jgi:hypothetical protein
MKREWLSYIDEAEARGDLEEARAFQTQLEKIYSLLESIDCDPTEDLPDAFVSAVMASSSLPIVKSRWAPISSGALDSSIRLSADLR